MALEEDPKEPAGRATLFPHRTVLELLSAVGPARLLWLIVSLQRRWKAVMQRRARDFEIARSRNSANITANSPFECYD
jgi:hypothetical protein